MLNLNNGFIELIEPDSCKFTNTLYEISHIHSNFEFVFCLEGKAEAIINQRSFSLNPGQGVMVFPGQIHLYKTFESGRFCVVVFKPEIIPTFKSRFGLVRPEISNFSFLDREKIKSVLYALEQEYTFAEENSALLCGYINLLTHYITPLLSFVSFSDEDSKLLTRISEYCAAHFKENISVSQIAKALFTNPNRISSVFNTNMNMRIPQYIEFLRLSAACDLLKRTSLSILEVSEECGFGSVRSLNRAFSEVLNTTPKDFRKNYASDYKIEIGGF